MDTTTVNTELAGINAKLDVILEEVDALKRQRLALAELRDDLSLIARDMFNSAVVELEDVAPFVNSGDFIHLVKKLLRNTASITESITRFEAALDIVETASPIGKDLFRDTLHKLDDLDQKGYFELAGSVVETVDTVVENMCREDCSQFGNKVVIPMVDVMKSVACSDVIPALQRTVSEIETKDPEDFEISPLKALQILNSPEVRGLLGFMVMFLQTLAVEIKKNTETKENS